MCGAVRARSLVPILALGDQTDEAPVLAAYSAGADQYVTIDTSSRLVTARLRALLRRVPPRSAAAVEPNPDLTVTIDEATGSVRVDGAVVSLSRRELEVLRTLLSRPGRVVTRAELAGAWPALSADRRLDFVIRRLRQKLEMVDGRRRINSVRGVGFRFEEDQGLDSAEGGAGMTEDVASGSAAVHVRFNGWSGRPLTVDPVTAGDALPPEAVEATDAAGAALIDAFVARRRAELARLSLAARTARQRCERAETELADVAAMSTPTACRPICSGWSMPCSRRRRRPPSSHWPRPSARPRSSSIGPWPTGPRSSAGRVSIRRSSRPIGPFRSTSRSVVAPPTAAELWRT